MTGEFYKLIRRFKNENELENWLKHQKKDCLYSIYMQETNYDGATSREITRNELKEMIRTEYYKLEEERIRNEEWEKQAREEFERKELKERRENDKII